MGILEEEVPDLIQVPKPLEHASVVGDHLNFHLVNPTAEENLAFQVLVLSCLVTRRVSCNTANENSGPFGKRSRLGRESISREIL